MACHANERESHATCVHLQHGFMPPHSAAAAAGETASDFVASLLSVALCVCVCEGLCVGACWCRLSSRARGRALVDRTYACHAASAHVPECTAHSRRRRRRLHATSLRFAFPHKKVAACLPSLHLRFNVIVAARAGDRGPERSSLGNIARSYQVTRCTHTEPCSARKCLFTRLTWAARREKKIAARLH